MVSCPRLYGGFPNKRGTFFGVPIIGTIAFWSLYWGSPYFGNPPILGNYHIGEWKIKRHLLLFYLGMRVQGFKEYLQVWGENVWRDVHLWSSRISYGLIVCSMKTKMENHPNILYDEKACTPQVRCKQRSHHSGGEGPPANPLIQAAFHVPVLSPF